MTVKCELCLSNKDVKPHGDTLLCSSCRTVTASPAASTYIGGGNYEARPVPQYILDQR